MNSVLLPRPGRSPSPVKPIKNQPFNEWAYCDYSILQREQGHLDQIEQMFERDSLKKCKFPSLAGPD